MDSTRPTRVSQLLAQYREAQPATGSKLVAALAKATTPHETALALKANGLHPTPTRVKAPIGKRWGREWTVEELAAQFNHPTQPADGVGIILGPLSGVVDIDCDGPLGEETLDALFDGPPPETLGWRSTRGRHRLYRWDDRLEAIGKAKLTHDDLPDIEILLGAAGAQTQAVCPPSPKDDGTPREWVFHDEIAPLPDEVVEILLALAEQKKTTPARKHNPSENGHTNHGNTPADLIKAALPNPRDKHAASALKRLHGELATTPSGSRNDTTFKVAARIGAFVGAGRVDADGAQRLLEHATTTNGALVEERDKTLDTIASALAEGAKTPEYGGMPEERESTASILVKLADDLPLICTPRRRAYAMNAPTPGVAVEITSEDFVMWLGYALKRARNLIATTDALDLAKQQLVGEAKFGRGTHREVWLRSAPYGERGLLIDLGHDDGAAVAITPGQKPRIITDHDAAFVRPPNFKPLPDPNFTGDLNDLRRLLNLGTGGGADAGWRLCVAFVVAAILPQPLMRKNAILSLSGETGAAKTSFARSLRAMIDPSHTPDSGPPRDYESILRAAGEGKILVLDNLSHVDQQLSDLLCRITSGTAMQRRKNYTDYDMCTVEARCPIIINGIPDLARFSDLANRTLAIALNPITPSTRLDDDEWEAEVVAATPNIIGGLYNVTADVLRLLPDVPKTNLKRLTAIHRIGRALETVMGWPRGSFDCAMDANETDLYAITASDSPIAGALRKRFLTGAPVRTWTGSAGELLDELNSTFPSTDRHRPRGWPTTAHHLAGLLMRLAPAFRRELRIERDVTHGNQKRFTIARPGPNRNQRNPTPPPASPSVTPASPEK